METSPRRGTSKAAALAAAAGVALLAIVVSLVLGALAPNEAPAQRPALAPASLGSGPAGRGFERSAALTPVPAAQGMESPEPESRVAVAQLDLEALHPELARLEVIALHAGAPVAGACVALRGLGDVFAGPGTLRGGHGELMTDSNGMVRVAVRSMSTWYIAVSRMGPSPLAGEFVGTSPPAGRSRRLEIELAPSVGPRFVHLRVVSSPSGAALPGASLKVVNGAGLMVTDASGSTEALTDGAGSAVLIWPEGTTVLVQAAGHTARAVTWGDAQRPVAELVHPDSASAGRARPLPLEVAAHASVYGQFDPRWASGAVVRGSSAWSVAETSSRAITRGFALSAAVDELGAWRCDGLPAALPADPDRVLRASETPLVSLECSGRGFGPQGAISFVEIDPLVQLVAGEQRVIADPFPELQPFEAHVTLDGAPLDDSSLLTLSLIQAGAREGPEREVSSVAWPSGAVRRRASDGAVIGLPVRLTCTLALDGESVVRAPWLPVGHYSALRAERPASGGELTGSAGDVWSGLASVRTASGSIEHWGAAGTGSRPTLALTTLPAPKDAVPPELDARPGQR
ncbi:MAG: hypothetical protein R3F49_09055 [Planctomycetota bacterium]